MTNKINHHCIICGKGYYHCNDCNEMKSFSPWRKVACSTECYQAYLAFMEYRDDDHDALKFVKQIDWIGIELGKLSEPLAGVYEMGKNMEKTEAGEAEDIADNTKQDVKRTRNKTK